MCNLLRLGVVISLLVAGNIVNAAPAVALVVNCIPSASLPPGTCFTHTSGQPFTFWVVAVDATNQLATDYTGTVSITSSDPTATLPPDHTFTQADGSLVAFAITLNSLGPNNPPFQTVTATDSRNGLIGNQNFVVAAASSVAYPTPTLSTQGQLLLGALLFVLAIFSLRSRASAKRPGAQPDVPQAGRRSTGR